MPKLVTDIDKGWHDIKNVVAKLMHNASVKIGIQGSEAEAPHPEVTERNEDGSPKSTKAGKATNADIGAIHEFGMGVPERSWLRGTMDREKKSHQSALTKAATEILNGATVDAALGNVGELVLLDIRKTIDRSIGLEQLSGTTVENKGSSKPLIDTGDLKQSITYVVIKK